jgi:predicted DCC family thiol-disulfide oxidoreductase YuxK
MEARHLILFDGQCGFCRRLARDLMARDRAGAFRAVPYQEAPAPPMTAELRRACAGALHVVRSDGVVLRGGRAVLFILEHTGLGRAARVAALPPFLWGVERGYRVVARHRAWLDRVLGHRA